MNNKLFKKINNLITFNRFRIITFTLVVFILVSPYSEETFTGRILMSVLTISVIISIIFTVLRKTKMLTIALTLGASLIFTYVIFIISNNFVAEVISNFLFVIIYLFAIHAIFFKILQRGDITSDTIFAAISVYILLGVMYGCIYYLIEMFHPGAFKFTQTGYSPHFELRYDLTYFSFVILTTVGLGDIIPVSGYAKSIVILEAITGIFYIAILVSRLVAGLERKNFQNRFLK